MGRYERGDHCLVDRDMYLGGLIDAAVGWKWADKSWEWWRGRSGVRRYSADGLIGRAEGSALGAHGIADLSEVWMVDGMESIPWMDERVGGSLGRAL